MIRFVRIGDQINDGEDAFAFFDTVMDQFVEVNGEHVWSSREDLLECADEMEPDSAAAVPVQHLLALLDASR